MFSYTLSKYIATETHNLTINSGKDISEVNLIHKENKLLEIAQERPSIIDTRTFSCVSRQRLHRVAQPGTEGHMSVRHKPVADSCMPKK